MGEFSFAHLGYGGYITKWFKMREVIPIVVFSSTHLDIMRVIVVYERNLYCCLQFLNFWFIQEHSVFSLRSSLCIAWSIKRRF